MKTISPEEVQETWLRMDEVSAPEVQEIVERMQTEQPFITAYLLARDEELYDSETRGTLLQLGTMAWLVMSSARGILPQVTGEEIDAAEEANIQLLSAMDEGSEIQLLGTAQDLFTNYNQMPLLGAVLESLMSDSTEEDEPPDDVGLALLTIKTRHRCLRQIAPSGRCIPSPRQWSSARTPTGGSCRRRMREIGFLYLQ